MAPEVLEDLVKEPFGLCREIRGEPAEYHRRLRGENLTAKETEIANADPYITSAIWRRHSRRQSITTALASS
jgi:hypothetical protein